jgi:hypothetical protein
LGATAREALNILAGEDATSLLEVGGKQVACVMDIINIYYEHSYVNGDAREIAIQLRNEIRMAEAAGYYRDPIRGSGAETLLLIVFFGRRCDYYS